MELPFGEKGKSVREAGMGWKLEVWFGTYLDIEMKLLSR